MSAEKHLKSIIEAQGPLTIAQFMGIALSDSKYGYYTQANPLGAKGDFITSPEISQMFGEMIGIWCASIWQDMGEPDNVTLVELGPGKGTLMNDLLRGTKNVPGFHESISISLVEISPVLRKEQEKALADTGVKVSWHDSFTEISDGPIILVANEFFDALPIQQFVKTADGWREKMVALDRKGKLIFAISPAETPSVALITEQYRESSPVESLYEICPAAISISNDIAAHINTHGGAALFIDYGYDVPPLQDSLQAVKNHKFHPVLKNPGAADLTAHIDFSAILKTAGDAGVATYGPIGQGELLRALGIDVRAEMLSKGQNDEVKQSIANDILRLTLYLRPPQSLAKIFPNL